MIADFQTGLVSFPVDSNCRASQCELHYKSPSSLTLKAFPKLTVETADPIYTGSKINVNVDPSAGSSWNSPVYAAFITFSGPVFGDLSVSSDGCVTVTVPAGVHGQSYLVLTSSSTSVSDDTTVAGPAVLEVCGTDGSP